MISEKHPFIISNMLQETSPAKENSQTQSNVAKSPRTLSMEELEVLRAYSQQVHSPTKRAAYSDLFFQASGNHLFKRNGENQLGLLLALYK